MNTLHSKKLNILSAGLILALCITLVACSDKTDSQKASEAAVKTQPQKPQTTIERLVQFPEKDLRDNARKATMDNRWYKPSGNNALEYYLALKMKLKAPDESVELALADILPYAVIGMDQAINKFDDKEALRLESLIRMADPNAPALARVKTDLEKMKVREALAAETAVAAEKAKADQEAKALADAAKAKLDAANRAQEQAAVAPAPVVNTPAPAAPVVQQQAPVPVVRAPAPAPAPAPATRAPIVPISTPQPPYPKEAMKTGATGEVTVDISINEIGDVSDVVIVNSKPGRMFDKTVINTVRSWKYRGNGEATTVRRTFVFK
jgi:protein TonB